MKKSILACTIILASSVLLTACNEQAEPQKNAPIRQLTESYQGKLNIYKDVTLSADLSHLSEKQHKMLALLIEASDIIDQLFWQQAFSENKTQFLNSIENKQAKTFASINYGPWDRMNGDTPFLQDIKQKSLGAEFYPHDMSKEEFEQANFEDKTGLYSLVRRNEQGELIAIAYSEAYHDELQRIAAILQKAATFAEDKDFAKYLTMRAEALLTDDYQPSDFAWMDMKNNPIDVVIGPIETYEDQLYGYRAAFESYVLIKDMAWSEKLAKYAEYLPELQKGLPVSKKYRKEMPGTDADLNAYEVIYATGHANAGGKTIAINLPNDEQVQLEKGTRRLQLKNAMRAKYDAIMEPIAEVLIVPEQRKHVTFTAFFANTMFHEVAHGLGIKNTINNKGTVRQALKEHASALEEGKADILGLYMVRQLLEKKVITEGELEDYYTTFLAGIFRSVRFGASSAHGKANMVRFNYFAEQGAFTRNEKGLYQVNYQKMTEAINSLSTLILTLQGTGDYEGVDNLVKQSGIITEQLSQDLARLNQANIPVDITYQQGKKQLGLH
ncbi:Zn-dependent hydrolase [Thalassotalea sp. 1_MG-2023]|uniref:dipeptidyl-peptidase 3 family protein n=1 Tax=Thalassotalea sp. 1_MG-2023 TaxID=3062680 RepID=UPI0026E1A934|nr:Zn-dependent hydrolase [Thalassotalea sp. 1_MG-2023]MDO6427831.1 Zn-dependent hydrolase [Thalassotalea sp. 1_MG-2023]